MQMPCAWLLCKLPLGRDMLAGSKWCYSGKRLMSLLTFSAFQVHHFPSVPQFTNLLNSVILVSLCKVLIMNSNQEVRATKAENRSLFRSLQFLHILITIKTVPRKGFVIPSKAGHGFLMQLYSLSHKNEKLPLKKAG